MIAEPITKQQIEEIIESSTESIKAIVTLLQTMTGEGVEIKENALFFSLQAIKDEAERIEQAVNADTFTAGEIKTIAEKLNLTPEQTETLFFNQQTA